MSYPLQQNQTSRPLLFLMVDSADHITGKIGLTPTVTISKNGAVFASPAGAVTEVGVGWYKVAGNATDENTLGPLIVHATSSGADDSDTKFEIVAWNPDDSIRLGLTSLPNVAPGTAAGLIVAGTGANQLNPADGRIGVDWSNVGNPTTTLNLSGTTVGVVTSVGDKTGYSLSAAGIDAIWDEAQAGHTGVGTFGLYLDDQITRVPTGVWSFSDRQLTVAQTGLITAADVWNHSTRILTAAPTGLITANDVWTHPSRTLTEAPTGLITAADVWNYVSRTLTSAPTGLITAADVWNYVTRTLTATAAPTGLITAADVWGYVNRSLTTNVGVTGVVECNLVQITGLAPHLATLNIAGFTVNTMTVNTMLVDGVEQRPLRLVEGFVDAIPSTTTFDSYGSELSTGTGVYTDMWLHFMTGDIAGISRVVNNYVGGASKVFTFDKAFPAVPASGDRFILISYTDEG